MRLLLPILLQFLSSHSTECFSTSATSSVAFVRHHQGHRTTSSSSRLQDSADYFEKAEEDIPLTQADVQDLTVPQLKQQLRLRGLKVSGRKTDLINRLVGGVGGIEEDVDAMEDVQDVPPTSLPAGGDNNDDDLMLEHHVVIEGEDDIPLVEPEVMPAPKKKSKARQFSESRGKELIDVTAYLDEDDAEQSTRSSSSSKAKEEPEDEMPAAAAASTDPEAWGKEAKIVDDYEGRNIVVDNLSRCVVEFTGSNQTSCQAFVVASRDALKAFLGGGSSGQNATSPEERLLEIQSKREDAIKTPWKAEDDAGLDQDDEQGHYKDVLHRDYSDWGEYSATGAQLSALEVQGVLLLSDVYGPFTNDTRALAEKIAFECQPVVVMAPDVFRGNPWKEVDNSGLNQERQTYEQWRATHDDLRVNIDIRAAAACLRERYGVSSIVVWGTCFGGGRALEAASGVFPNDNVHDIDGNIGPLPVDPMACIAWYPTRYDLKGTFGKTHTGRKVAADGSERKVAVMAIFAGNDEISGATPEDAAALKECLGEDDRVNDFMVKVFPGQDHGFAHNGLGLAHEDSFKEDYESFVDDEFGGAGRVTFDTGEAEVACLLSTAWMETYSRVFLPTVGPTVSKDENEEQWQSLNMKGLDEANGRDIREEIETALNDFSYSPSGGGKLDRFDEESHEELKKTLMEYQKGQDAGDNQILPSDDLHDAYEKLRRWDSKIQLF